MYNSLDERSSGISGQLGEIQGIVSSGYGAFRFMSCLLFQFKSPKKARRSLKKVLNQVSFNDELTQKSDRRLNLAFSWKGLCLLNDAVANEGEELFKREFKEGMDTEYRRKLLGDLDDTPSSPREWLWGRNEKLWCQNEKQVVDEKQEVHLAVLVYEGSEEKRETRVKELLETLEMELVDRGRIDSQELKQHKEHFGFRDGISQPWMKGLSVTEGSAADEVAWGEVVLGYQDNTQTVERHPEIAFNGSYLVIRQIEQDVKRFWDSFSTPEGDPVKLAAKQMGRWPDGTPVTLEPDAAKGSVTNDFDYKHDPHGINCPVGSHVRRCNPRTAPGRNSGKKNRHRILRRGRAYGAAAPAEYFPPQLRSEVSQKAEVSQKDHTQDESRGLLFMCLNANFERQFEFMQRNWINGLMGTLAGELDPVASQLNFETFTLPDKPFRKRCPRGDAYVKTVGGGYFFLPSRSAMRKILD